MSLVDTRNSAVWFDHANTRFEGPTSISESGIYSGRPFEDVLVENGLIADSCRQLCDIFHVDTDNPSLGIESGLQHITIGDNKGGSHLPTVILELVPDAKFYSSLTSVGKDVATKVVKKQRVRPDGTFRILGDGSDVAYCRDGEQVWRKKHKRQNSYFPISWTATDLILAIHDNLVEEPQYNERTHNLQRVSTYMGVLLRTISDGESGKVISAYPTKLPIAAQ